MAARRVRLSESSLRASLLTAMFGRARVGPRQFLGKKTSGATAWRLSDLLRCSRYHDSPAFFARARADIDHPVGL